MRNEKRRFNILLIGTCAIIVFMVFGTMYVLGYVDGANLKVESVRAKKYVRTLVEGLRVSKNGVYGIDFVKCGSCRLEKMRKGPLTFGGFNVLAIEDLQVVLPSEAEVAQNVQNEKGLGRPESYSIAKRLGISDGFLSSHEIPFKFSGLRINLLAVNRLSDDGKGVEKVFAAEKAEAVRGGLSLSGCTIFRSRTKGEFVGKAMLSKSGSGLCLAWRGGEMKF